MWFPEEKERENRFKLALRMGLPVFALAVITMASAMMRYFDQIPSIFIIIAFGVLGVMVYYHFYMIYQGFHERITDPITLAFSREYFTKLMRKELKKKDYTFLLFSVINLNDINKQFGFSNGDRVLKETAKRISDYLFDRHMERVPVAHFKGGDFIIALEGKQEQYRSLMEILCVKFNQLNFDDIEVETVGSMSDSTRANSFDKIVDWLFELQSENIKMLKEDEDVVDPDTIEQLVYDAIRTRSFSYRFQAAFKEERVLLYETAVKLVLSDQNLIHQKRFMPVINRLGLLRQFDEIQTEAAIDMINRLDGHELVAVNVAPSTLRNPHFFEYVMNHLSDNVGLKSRLVFVMSEQNYYHQTKQFDARLQAFRRVGIRIAIDRVGGLHSSLRYLQELKIDMVRFEGAFTKHVDDQKSRAILEGLAQITQKLGYLSWIRMIETEPQYSAVKAIGIDILQGNYISPVDTIKE